MVRAAVTNRGQQNILDQVQRVRFAEYFPRVFAYAQCATSDQTRSTEIVVEAFSRVFEQDAWSSDEGFPVALFAVARDLCESAPALPGYGAGRLNARERDVLSLVFDAQLTRDQVSSVMKLPEDSVISALVNGLRNLKRTVLDGRRPSFQVL